MSDSNMSDMSSKSDMSKTFPSQKQNFYENTDIQNRQLIFTSILF